MPFSDGVPSSPPGPGSSPEDALNYYKAQYESLEADLVEFQASSKDLEAELERDIEAAEKRERDLKDKATKLQYDVDEWKVKYNQAKKEANAAQNQLQKEVTALRDQNRSLQHRLRDIEVANDDIERQQRNTESSLTDMESKYNQTIERGLMLDQEMKAAEQEREAMRIEAQRLKDQFSDLKIENEITKEKLRKTEGLLERARKPLTIDLTQTASPRSELSPTTTNDSSPSFDTPPPKTASSSGISDTPTPPSPPVSEKSASITEASPKPKAFVTPNIPKTRTSIIANNNTTPRQLTYSSRTTSHVRGSSVQANSRGAPSSAFRQSMSKPLPVPRRGPGLPPSGSLMQLRTLRGNIAKLSERVHTATSKLPGPVNTPPKASPRTGSALGQHIPSSVTVRSGRKRATGSTISGVDSLPDQGTPSIKPMSGRTSIGYQRPASPTKGDMAPPQPRPSSRASTSSRLSMNSGAFVPGHSRPGSRASMSFRTPLGLQPNASTDAVRPHSSLSTRSGLDGNMDEVDEENKPSDYATPTPRRTTIGKRTSDVGSAIPSPTKRLSYGMNSKLPAPANRRQSSGLSDVTMRPPSRQINLNDVQEGYDPNETF
jgi:hypothetical protein